MTAIELFCRGVMTSQGRIQSIGAECALIGSVTSMAVLVKDFRSAIDYTGSHAAIQGE